jgi:hypothetical protein
MVASSNSNHLGLVAGLKLYISRQTSNPKRYLLEQLLYALVGWVPSLAGIGLRAMPYRLILHMDGMAAIAYSKQLPLDIALFHIATPYPSTPFFFEVVEQGWFRPGTRWEEVDMDQSTVLDHPDLPAERLEYRQRRATLEWSLRPGPIRTFLKGLNTWQGLRSAVSVGWQTLRFVTG